MADAKFFENQTEITVSQGVTTAAYLNDAGGFPMSLPNQATTALIDRFMPWVNFKEVISHWLGNKAAIEFMGLTYDGDDPVLMKATMIGTAISMGKPLGELYFLDSLKTPVELDKDNPETFFPGKCLDTINIFEDIPVAEWPDFVPHLRAKKLTYNEGITGEKSAFDVTDWDITSNVATLTFANSTAELAILAALLEDNLVHGSYTDWRSITLASAIGDVSAGEYAITNVDASLREITFAFTSGNNSGSGSFTSEFYTNRVPGSTTTARLYETTARSLVSANDSEGENINGLRRRDRFQGHWHEYYVSRTLSSGAGTALDQLTSTGAVLNPNQDRIQNPITNGPDGTPRIGTTTDPRSLGAHLYIHGKSYVAP
jgi:hypothetical protein